MFNTLLLEFHTLCQREGVYPSHPPLRGVHTPPIVETSQSMDELTTIYPLGLYGEVSLALYAA